MFTDFACPFKECGNITCDFMGVKPEDGIMQCPTQIFNKCQCDIAFNEEDKNIIKETVDKLTK